MHIFLNIRDLERRLLPWFDINQRQLPWRALPGHSTNPYYVWLSEIMLQQTTVFTVKDYFIQFIERWPNLEALATATLDEIYHVWQGLGYYSRARHLHHCVQVLVKDFKGDIPKSEDILLTLPGIGPYTAAAIAAIAYNQPTVPVDGNVVRVITRLLSLTTPLPMVKQEVQTFAKGITPTYRSGDFAQSLMDLGAMICRPKNPSCDICPLQDICNGWLNGVASQLPYPANKAAKPRRYGIVFWVENDRQEILLEKRPEKGLLGGLTGLPTTEWRNEPWDSLCEQTLSYLPLNMKHVETLPSIVNHTFTHFHLELRIMKGVAKDSSHGQWSSLENLASYAFPTVMKKVIEKARSYSASSLPRRKQLAP